MENNTMNLMVEPSLVREFYGLLQAGFTVKCQVGVSIENLFFEQLGFDSLLVEKKISTIFLNGKPVDDIAATIIHDGSTLALSGAMPGLVGATLRKKSPLASFRQSINAGKDSETTQKKEGHIQIKLFNILLDELGPGLLERGMFFSSDKLKEFFEKQAADFWQRCKEFFMDGQRITSDQLLSHLASHGSNVFLVSVRS